MQFNRNINGYQKNYIFTRHEGRGAFQINLDWMTGYMFAVSDINSASNVTCDIIMAMITASSK